jgi:DNA-binding XRE family transcriptional regulator
LKTKALKTQVNHELRLNHVRIPGALFARALDAVRARRWCFTIADGTGQTRRFRRVLARNVRSLRLARGMSQEELAAESATRQPLVSATEAGDANPTLGTLGRLAIALGVSIAELFESGNRGWNEPEAQRGTAE